MVRTKVIQKLIHINESIFFYPKLRRFYISKIIKEQINILDVGANKGQSIDFFLKVYPKANIDSFEPNKRLYKFLKEKYITTNNKKENINVHNFGVSNLKGELMFYENIMDETSTFEELNLESKYLEKKAKYLGVTKENIIIDNYKVEIIKLSDFINDKQDTFFDILKIDVEGHELQCLQGLFHENPLHIPIRFIQLESHNDDMYFNNNQQTEIEYLLNINHFHKVAEFKHGFGDFTEIIYENTKIK